jgi:DNA-binding GntR family transcriptional regulator
VTPVYRRVYDDIRGAIERGEITDQLPVEPELAERYAVSRQTVRAGLSLLRADGIIEPVQGSGWFVTGSGDRRPLDVRLGELLGSGRFKPGDQIPSEHALCAELGTTRPTLRNALARLEGRGVIRSVNRRRVLLALPDKEES